VLLGRIEQISVIWLMLTIYSLCRHPCAFAHDYSLMGQPEAEMSGLVGILVVKGSVASGDGFRVVYRLGGRTRWIADGFPGRTGSVLEEHGAAAALGCLLPGWRELVALGRAESFRIGFGARLALVFRCSGGRCTGAGTRMSGRLWIWMGPAAGLRGQNCLGGRWIPEVLGRCAGRTSGFHSG